MRNNKEINLGKSWTWWMFSWPVHRRLIKKYYELGEIKLASSYLLHVIPEATPGTREMVKYLAKKYRWKNAAND